MSSCCHGVGPSSSTAEETSSPATVSVARRSPAAQRRPRLASMKRFLATVNSQPSIRSGGTSAAPRRNIRRYVFWTRSWASARLPVSRKANRYNARPCTRGTSSRTAFISG
jgi:hypothetical protein